jgi:hypothetical protein
VSEAGVKQPSNFQATAFVPETRCAEQRVEGWCSGLEEAARICDEYRREDNTMLESAAEYIAKRIRALLPSGKT